MNQLPPLTAACMPSLDEVWARVPDLRLMGTASIGSKRHMVYQVKGNAVGDVVLWTDPQPQ